MSEERCAAHRALTGFFKPSGAGRAGDHVVCSVCSRFLPLGYKRAATVDVSLCDIVADLVIADCRLCVPGRNWGLGSGPIND